MREDKYTARLSVWLDHELSPNEVVELKQHLQSCDNCQQNYQAMQQVDGLFRQAALQMVAPTAGFSQRFESRLNQHQTERRQAWLAILALLLGAILLFIFIISSSWGFMGMLSSDLPTLQQGQIQVIHLANTAHSWLNLLGVLVKASFIVMTQPLFWGLVIVSLIVTGLWGRLMQVLYQQQSLNSPMLT
jgi:predicted anti-sigma-YlaC factor YlaD